MTVETVAVAASAAHQIPKPYQAGFVGVTFSAALATTSLDDVGDIIELGYLPAGCTVVGFIISTASLAASALVYKITIGGVDAITGITTGSGAGSGFWGVSPAPLTLTVVSKVQLNITTVATTPAAGTLYLTCLYTNG
jgi:hypothetical protein